MSSQTLPSTIKAWQYSTSKGGIETNMTINPSAPMPTPKPNQHLVQIIACALNPFDHKVAEIPLVDRFFNPKPATPGVDFSGRIVKPAVGTPFQPGQLVFGCAGKTPPIAGGGLAEYALVQSNFLAPIPAGVDPIDAATIGVVGLTALQTGQGMKSGEHIFINGGSGGTGVFAIQIAKARGCYVTTSCSSANVAFCEQLGADRVIDYKAGSVTKQLADSGEKFDRVVDNIGSDLEIYWKAHEYTHPSAKYVMVGGMPSLGLVYNTLKAKVWPGVLGGAKRTRENFFAQPNTEDLERIVEWVREGKVKTVVDSKFSFGEAVQAFERLKGGRAKGKIVIEVAA